MIKKRESRLSPTRTHQSKRVGMLLLFLHVKISIFNKNITNIFKLIKEKNTEALQSAQKEMKQIKELINKQNNARCSPASPIVSENSDLHDYENVKKVAFPRRVRYLS